MAYGTVLVLNLTKMEIKSMRVIWPRASGMG